MLPRVAEGSALAVDGHVFVRQEPVAPQTHESRAGRVPVSALEEGVEGGVGAVFDEGVVESSEAFRPFGQQQVRRPDELRCVDVGDVRPLRLGFLVWQLPRVLAVLVVLERLVPCSGVRCRV